MTSGVLLSLDRVRGLYLYIALVTLRKVLEGCSYVLMVYKVNVIYLLYLHVDDPI